MSPLALLLYCIISGVYGIYREPKECSSEVREIMDTEFPLFSVRALIMPKRRNG